MKKKLLRYFSMILGLCFLSLVVVGCSPYKEATRASKGLSCYNITASLNDEDKTICATEIVEFKNQTNVILETVCFNMYGRAFREDATIKPYTSLNEGKCFPSGVNYGDVSISSVKENGEAAPYNIVGVDDNALEVELSKKLEPGDTTTIEINFTLKMAQSTHRLGYYDNSINLGNWFLILAEYEGGEYNLTPYYSTGDPFYSSIANYEVKFTYPNSYNLSSSGTLEKRVENSDGTRTDLLSAISVRDFALALTGEAKTTNKKVDDITISYVGYSTDDNVDYALDIAVKAVKFFSDTFGKYPYAKLDVVKAPFVHGGMEYPSMVIISDSITDNFDIAKVIVHEIAHQWWYGVVGNNEIDEAWLDESLAEYSSILFFEKYSEFGVSYEELVSEAFAGYTLYADIISTVNGKMNTSMLLSVNEYVSEYEYSYMIYIRGVLMLDNLRQVIGKEKLIKGFKYYYNKYKFKIATTDDFIVSMRKYAGKDIEGLLDSWLSGKTIVGAVN